MASVIEKKLHLDVVSFCYDWGLRYLVILVNETKQSSKYKLGFGLGTTFYALGWFWICTTAPLLHGALVFLNLIIAIHRLDNSRLKCYTPFMFIVTFA